MHLFILQKLCIVHMYILPPAAELNSSCLSVTWGLFFFFYLSIYILLDSNETLTIGGAGGERGEPGKGRKKESTKKTGSYIIIGEFLLYICVFTPGLVSDSQSSMIETLNSIFNVKEKSYLAKKVLSIYKITNNIGVEEREKEPRY